MSKKDNIIVGLDIGTTKICCIVGEIVEAGPNPVIDVVGIGTAPSTGLRKGVVVHIENTVKSISKAVEEAELMAGVDISTVYAGIAGAHIKSFNSSGIVAVKDREINEQDVARVIEAAKAVAVPQDREVLHVIPQEYRIDENDGIRNPIGMSGVRLESKVHIVTGAVASAQNLVKCANKSGLDVAEICLQPLASAEAVLSYDEKELGVVLVDIGGGTSDIAVYRNGAIVYTGVLAIGGSHLTNDLALGLRTPQPDAERIKVQHGCALQSLVGDDEMIEVPDVGGRKSRSVPRRLVAEILEPRVQEIFLLIQRDLVAAGFKEPLAGGVVLTGGSALLDGMPELAEMILEMPVKRGVPLGVGGLKDVVNSPRYATAVGLMKFGARNAVKARTPLRDQHLYDRVKGSMKNWLKDLF